jgi:hypothetical protein
MEWFIIAVNIIGFIFIIRLTYYDHHCGAFLYPILDTLMVENDFSLFTRILTHILFTILFFPAICVYFLLLILLIFIVVTISIINDKRRKHK